MVLPNFNNVKNNQSFNEELIISKDHKLTHIFSNQNYPFTQMDTIQKILTKELASIHFIFFKIIKIYIMGR